MRKTELLFERMSDKKYVDSRLQQVNLMEHIVNSLPIGLVVTTENGEKVYSNRLYDALISKEHLLRENKLVTDENQLFKVNMSTLENPSALEQLKVFSLINISDEIKEQEEKERAFTMIAHDLKSPIYSQKIALETLLKGKMGKLSPKQEEIISMIYNSNVYSSNLVGEILCAYKLGKNNFNLNIEKFDLAETVNSCKKILKYLSADKNVSLKIISPKHCIVNGDRTELQRAVMNLLVNAVKYAEVSTEIKVILDVTDNIVTFTVQNFGQYIPDDCIKKIFNKDFSIAKKGLQLGTGLGLYLTKRIIKLHSGKMIAKSFKSGVNIFGFVIKSDYVASAKRTVDAVTENC